MSDASVFALGALAWALAAAAVVLGRNLTRSVVIGYAFLALLCLVLLMAGAGFLAAVVSILAAVGLATIQVFGWMLVDVDRDHLSPTDPGTWIARGLAFVVLGVGLAALVAALHPELLASGVLAPIGLAALGRALFGPLAGAAILLGLAIAAALLATMLLLRDEEEG
jgi:NADH:ubiquinone oxidoreductase subunit 6 (subunit J)